MYRLSLLYLGIICLTVSCNAPNKTADLLEFVKDSPNISGKQSYLNSPFVTAGDRLYMVGHQNGRFPELGWHVKGEMGGIWNHPIKLMDGFDVAIQWEENIIALDSAKEFINYPYANRHSYAPIGDNGEITIDRFQFVPDSTQGILVQFKLQNNTDRRQEFEFIFDGHTDLMPVWLGERTGMKDHPDEGSFNEKLELWEFKDSNNPWHTLFGANMPVSQHELKNTPYSGNGKTGRLIYKVDLDPQATEHINFTIAGSYLSKNDALQTYSFLTENAQQLLNKKKERYTALAEKSKLTIPDKKMQQTFEWLKYNCDWLIRDVPELGRGIAAGIPDYPWFFGVDSEYALQGYLAIGQTDIVLSTIDLLDSVSRKTNKNGRIIHEMSTNGSVFNPGNINETPQFASLIWNTYLWTGDKDFLKKYFPTIKEGLKWLLEENDANKNLFPDGFGMMEIHGMNGEMIDVASYSYMAFKDAAAIAEELMEPSLALEYNEIAQELAEKINKSYWSEKFKSFADFLGTDEQALHLVEDALVRADTLNKPWAVAELLETKQAILGDPSTKMRPFVLHHNWVVNTPMEVGLADEEKAYKALNTAKKFVNPFGVFVTGIDRDESAGSDDGTFEGSKTFSYTGAVMTLPTGVLAIAENQYGRPDNALDYLKRMTRSFSYALPGSMYEVSPDYGMMVQAWNIYSYAIPIVRQFFGISPKASEKRIQIKPQMPEEWDNASLENVVIADNSISIFHSNGKDNKSIEISQENGDWTIELILPRIQGRLYTLEGGEGKWLTTKEEIKLTTQDTSIQVKITE